MKRRELMLLLGVAMNEDLAKCARRERVNASLPALTGGKLHGYVPAGAEGMAR